MSTSWWAPLAMLFFGSAVTSVVRSRSGASLLRLLGVDLVAIAIVVCVRDATTGDARGIAIVYLAALAALLLTGALVGGTLRFGIDSWLARFTARTPQ